MTSSSLIGFVSLFLGLVLGPQTVVLQVADSISSVDLLLDGEPVTILEGPPWTAQCDLGAELSPHELVAVARDDQGVELDRAVQWVNLPRQPAETTVMVEASADGSGRVARVTWESLVDAQPSEVVVAFDGQPLQFQDPRAISLPPHDPEQLHFLRVELEFGGFIRSVAELTFGGSYADVVNTELTAVPVVLDGRKKMPGLTELQTWFSTTDDALTPAAVDKGPAEVIVVRDLGAWHNLRQLRSLARTDPTQLRNWLRPGHPGTQDHTVQLIWPLSRRLRSGKGSYDVFPHSQKFPGEAGSLHGWITTIESPGDLSGPQRLADAVAVAGVSAAGANRRRVVVLVLGASPEDASDIPPPLARRYLEHLHVPLVVWSTEAKPDDQVLAWGEVHDVSTHQRMERATRDLLRQLDRQRIIWFDGTHLPQDIALEPEADGVRLLNTPDQSG